MNNSPSYSRLYGTKTESNLIQAFEREASNSAKANIYADIASNDGDMSASRTLREGADNDRRLAELWLSYLDGIGDTIENLTELVESKNSLRDNVYPAMADSADEEGFYEIAEKMRLASGAKNSQITNLAAEKNALSPSQNTSNAPDTQWACKTCGYTVTGSDVPERCPLCSYPSGSFSAE